MFPRKRCAFFFILIWQFYSSNKPTNNKFRFFKLQAMPPFGSLMTSIPFLALTVLHYGNLWGLYFLITAAPKFMSEVSWNSHVFLRHFVEFRPSWTHKIVLIFLWIQVLGFNIAQAGVLASLPYLARLFAGFVFGTIGDSLTKAEVMSVTTIRKSFCTICKLFKWKKVENLAKFC